MIFAVLERRLIQLLIKWLQFFINDFCDTRVEAKQQEQEKQDDDDDDDDNDDDDDLQT